MGNWSPEDIDKAVKSVGAKAATDKKFREMVLKNPNEAIKEITGKDVPASYRLKIIEADSNFDDTFVLPPFRSEELSENELEQVAGGACKGAAGFCGAEACGVEV